MDLLNTSEYAVVFTSESRLDRMLCFDESGPCGHLDDGYWWGFAPRSREPWTGRFAHGMAEYSCVLATPSPWHCCVVMFGLAYLVDVAHPERTVALPCPDVVGHAGGPSSSLLALITFTELVGIRKSGEWWVSERLASDEIRNVTIDGDIVRGEGWIAATDTWTPFTLDAGTGRVIEGGMCDPPETN